MADNGGAVEAGLAELSWKIAFETFPAENDAFQAGVLGARIQSSLSPLIESQSAEIESQAEHIARLMHLDIHNSELLEAAIEGQSYWQARAEKLSEALDWALRNVSWLAHESDEYDEAIALLPVKLADAQQTQKPEEEE